MAEQFTAKFSVDISDLKKNIDAANKAIKESSAVFKNETAGMDKWSKSADGLAAKLKQLKSNLESQKTILQSYKDQLAKQQEAYTENGKRADALRAKLQELRSQGVEKTNAEYKQYEKALKSVLKEQQNNEKSVDSLKLSIIEQDTAIKTTQAQIEKYSASLNKLEAEQKQAAQEANRQKTAYETLENTIAEQQTRLNELKSKYADVVVEQGKSSDSAKSLAKQIDNLSSELAQNKKSLTDADDAADELDKSLIDLDKNSDKASDGFTVMKGALANLVSQGITAAINGLKNLASQAYESWKSYDEGADTIIAATGATGKAANELVGVYENVAKSVVGNFADIGSAVGEVNTRFGLTGNQLQKTSEKFLKFAELNETDVKTSIDDVQSAMAAFDLKAEDTSDFLDVLNKASQDTGVSVGQLTQQMVANGPALKEMGLNASDSAMFLANLSKDGIETSSVMTGMKKALANASKEGKPMSQALAEIEESIKNAKTPTDAINAAIDLFGTKAGPAIATAVQEGRLSFEEFGTTLTDFQGNIETTYDEMLDGPDKVTLAFQNLKLEAAKVFDAFLKDHGPQIENLIKNFTENILPKITKAVGKFFDALSWIIDHGHTITAIITGVGTAVGTFLAIINRQAILTAFTTLLGKIKVAFMALNATMAANPIGLVVAAITGLIAAFVYLWNTSEGFRNFWIGLWEKIKEVAKAAWEAISGFFEGAWNKVKEVWGGITDFFSSLWESIKEIFGTIASWINDNVFQPIIDFFEPVITFFEEAWDIISTLGKGCWEIIKKVWEIVSEWFKTKVIEPVKLFFSGLWDGIKNAASAAWEGIKSVWNAVSGWFDKTIIQPVSNFFSKMWDGIKAAASKAWEGIKSVFKPVADWFETKFKNAWTKVKNVFSTGGKIFDGIKEGITAAFKKVVNAIIGGINKVIATPFNAINKVLDKIRGAEILGIRPFKNLGSISVPQIPKLAQGGVLKRGQVGLLEGNGAEAVVPLDRNKYWIKAVANELLSDLKSTGIIGVGTNNTSTSTKTNNFTQIINAPKQPSRIELYRQTRNLLAYADTVG